ncbi:MAG TPA: S1C family serine protease [Methylomirabilota bacterium]|jgi:S1-C subfamily serine protease|nr:S1C family serine protease [Methylomirabilota bacterium]
MDASVELVKRLLPSVAYIHVDVPSAHPSTRHLGDERMGTGTVVDREGLILTVNYVVMGGKTIDVTFGRGRSQRAELIAQDFDVGLALLKVKRQGLPAAQMVSSEGLERGTPVFGLSSMGPRERRVAGGIVTYLGEFEAYWEYLLDRGIVSSAANPGFGGGPMFTLRGEMVGIISLNLSEISRNSLAIPTECYQRNRAELLRHGRVVSRPARAWLGVFATPLEEGVAVAGVVPNGPGARSGMQEGDVIVSLDSQEVPTRKDLYLSLWRHGPGEKIALEVLRDSELRVVHVTGGDRAEFYKQIS